MTQDQDNSQQPEMKKTRRTSSARTTKKNDAPLAAAETTPTGAETAPVEKAKPTSTRKKAPLTTTTPDAGEGEKKTPTRRRVSAKSASADTSTGDTAPTAQAPAVTAKADTEPKSKPATRRRTLAKTSEASAVAPAVAPAIDHVDAQAASTEPDSPAPKTSRSRAPRGKAPKQDNPAQAPSQTAVESTVKTSPDAQLKTLTEAPAKAANAVPPLAPVITPAAAPAHASVKVSTVNPAPATAGNSDDFVAPWLSKSPSSEPGRPDPRPSEEDAPRTPRRRQPRKNVEAAPDRIQTENVTPNSTEASAPRPIRDVQPTTPPREEPLALSAGSTRVERAQAPLFAEDDGIVAHILPPLDEQDSLNGEGRRRPRRRSRRKRRGDEMPPFQPEGFADVYPSSVVSAGLPDDAHFTFSDEDDFEDDGPQPALPNQPSLALPPATEDEDLEALDEIVNGNRIDASASSGNRRDRFTDRKGQPAQGKRSGRPERSPAPTRGVKAAPAKVEVEIEEEAPIVVGKRVLYVSVVPDEQVEVVITDDGQVTEYFVEMAHQAKIRGNIYKGVVNNVDTNLQAAFVNFGGGKNGFLQIDEVHSEYWLAPHDATRGPKYPPIQKVMKVGQEVLVQVVKEPAGTKGAFLTTWISLAGRYLVLTPGQEQIGVSRKVEDPEERARLKELLVGIEPGEDMGVIIRTASEGASKANIQKDLQFLKRLWKDIRKKGMEEKAPALIYQEADLAARAVRDYLAEDIKEIWVDDESTLNGIRETTSLLFPRRGDMVKLHQDPRQTLWERFNLQRQLEEVTSREVVLPSGGRLVFDQTEALMAIDINSGKTQGKSNFEAMVFRTNMEAAEAIARHLRLRDIGGQVVIDFIEMRDRNHCRDVEKTLRNAMRLDRARHDVGRMSSFGLLELVRQRTGTSAISISSEPCPHCHGTGVRRNMEWQALQMLRDIQAKLCKGVPSETSKQKNGRVESLPPVLVYDTDYELGLYLLNKKRDRLAELESNYSTRIEIKLK